MRPRDEGSEEKKRRQTAFLRAKVAMTFDHPCVDDRLGIAMRKKARLLLLALKFAR
jgi:hypothetical protein